MSSSRSSIFSGGANTFSGNVNISSGSVGTELHSYTNLQPDNSNSHSTYTSCRKILGLPIILIFLTSFALVCIFVKYTLNLPESATILTFSSVVFNFAASVISIATLYEKDQHQQNQHQQNQHQQNISSQNFIRSMLPWIAMLEIISLASIVPIFEKYGYDINNKNISYLTEVTVVLYVWAIAIMHLFAVAIVVSVFVLICKFYNCFSSRNRSDNRSIEFNNL